MSAVLTEQKEAPVAVSDPILSQIKLPLKISPSLDEYMIY